MPRHIITLLLFCCISLSTLADGVLLNEQHPDRHVLAINRAGRSINNPDSEQAKQPINLPDQRIGVLMVFRVFERASYALIMQANEPIKKLDSVLSPE